MIPVCMTSSPVDVTPDEMLKIPDDMTLLLWSPCSETYHIGPQFRQPIESNRFLRAVRLHHDVSAVMQADCQSPAHKTQKAKIN